MAKQPYEKERELQRDVARTVEGALPGVEVLALELTGKERFCVYVDHPQGVDHALCERVTGVLRPYLDSYSVEVSSPGLDRPCNLPLQLTLLLEWCDRHFRKTPLLRKVGAARPPRNRSKCGERKVANCERDSPLP